MRYSALLSIICGAALALAAPSTPKKRAACTSAVNITQSENPFATRTLHANSRYAAEVKAAAANLTDTSLQSQALAVADVGSFLWL